VVVTSKLAKASPVLRRGRDACLVLAVESYRSQTGNHRLGRALG